MITIFLIALAPAIIEAAPSHLAPLPLDPALVAMTQDTPGLTEPQWTGSVAFSAISTFGNTEQTTFNADTNAELRRDGDRFTWKGYWNYATDKSTGSTQLISRKVGTSLKYDYFLTENEKSYLFGNVGADYDALADLDLRFLSGGGMGYQFYETDELKFAGEAGLNYVIEDFQGPAKDEYVAARLAANLYKTLGEDTSLTASAELYPSLENLDDVYGRLDSKINTSLTESMFASLQWVVDYDNTPSGTKDRVDQRIIFAIGWSF